MLRVSNRAFASVGFIGIGNMGSRMAINLLKSRRSTENLYIFDKVQNTEAFKELVTQGALPVATASDIAKKCSVIFSMVPASAHVRELYFDHVLPSLSEKSLLIDCSTIDPETARRVHDASAASGHTMIDAPVSGGIKGAAEGTLTFMVGSSLAEADFDRDVRSVFSPMGRVIYCGGPGVGQSVKICNNLILGTQMLGVAEGYGLAQKLGVDIHKFNQIVNSSTGQCWTSTKYNPVPGLMENVPAARNYKDGFMTDLMIKDLNLAIDAARSAKHSVPVTEFSQSIYRKSSEAGLGSLDFGSIFKWLLKQDK